MGGAKAMVGLGGRPLIAYPLAALRAALADVVVLAKAETQLPDLPGATVWIEPPAPPHPLNGIVQAIELAGGRPVLVCAVDLPFVSPALVDRLAGCAGAPAAIVAGQPLLGLYRPEARPALSEALSRQDRVLEAVHALGPQVIEAEPIEIFNVNTPDDLLQAAALLSQSSTRT